MPYVEYVQHLRWPAADCPVIAMVDVRNEQFTRFRGRRSLPLTEED